MNESQYWIKLKFSDALTEIWNLTSGDTKIIDPTLGDGMHKVGIGLFLVPDNFCIKT